MILALIGRLLTLPDTAPRGHLLFFLALQHFPLSLQSYHSAISTDPSALPAWQGLAKFYDAHADAVERAEGKEATDGDRIKVYGKLVEVSRSVE